MEPAQPPRLRPTHPHQPGVRRRRHPVAETLREADRRRRPLPELAWSALPPGTAQLLLVVEDIDVPMSKPAVHCLA
ncbi:hypothetical protein N7U49_04430 [Streptomyces sp. AD2-2]|nr:hypothetical protein N7U49_04430 [Streptomyces sp. AD2-2]